MRHLKAVYAGIGGHIVLVVTFGFALVAPDAFKTINNLNLQATMLWMIWGGGILIVVTGIIIPFFVISIVPRGYEESATTRARVSVEPDARIGHRTPGEPVRLRSQA